MYVRPRAVAIALAILIVVEVLLRLPLPAPIPYDYRMPDRTTVGYDPLMARLTSHAGLRIALIGDSVVWGTFAFSEDTLSANLDRAMQRRGMEGHAANLGMSGAHANDLSPVIADVAEERAADVIVYQFDPRFFDEKQGIAYRYPELYDRIDDPDVREALASVTPTATAAWPGDIDETPAWLNMQFTEVSAIWRTRGYPVAAAFRGRKPAETLKDRVNELQGYQRKHTKRTLEQLPLDKIEQMYDIEPYTDDNPHMRNLAMALDIARERGIPVVIFSGPVDRTILDGQSLWDAPAYAANLAFVEDFARRHGAIFVDYTDAVPPEGMADTHHPLASGYEILADRILEDLEVLDLDGRR